MTDRETNPTDPYAAPVSQPEVAPDELANLDLSRLNPTEQKALEALRKKKSSFTWRTARFVSAIHVGFGILAYFGGRLDSHATISVAIKAAIYLALGYWAKSWSKLAALLTFAWHLFAYYQVILGPFRTGIYFVILAFAFLFGLLEAKTRADLIKKGKPSGPKGPHPIQLSSGEPSPINKPRFRTPGKINYDD